MLLAKSGDRYGFQVYVAVNADERVKHIATFPPGTGSNQGIAGTIFDSAFKIGDWTHVVYIFNENGADLYLNGNLSSHDDRIPVFATANNEDMYLGIQAGKGSCLPFWYPLNGPLDEVRIYNRSLSAAEVQALYQQGQGTPPAYSISGRVTDNSDTCASNVIISADPTHSVPTDDSGNYALTNLPAGTYTLTSSKTGCTFSPPRSPSITVPPDATSVNFTAMAISTTFDTSDWYRYQGEPSSGQCMKANANCGPASAAMAIQFARNQWVGIGDIRTFVGGNCNDNTNLDQIMGALDHWKVSYSNTPLVGIDSVVAAVRDRGHIAIVPVQMTKIERGKDFETAHTSPSDHFDKYRSADLHILVVKGVVYDSNKEWIVVYDPYVFGKSSTATNKYYYKDDTPKGKDRYYSYDDFKAAFEANGNKAIEIIPSDNQIQGEVKNSTSGQPITGASVLLFDSKLTRSTLLTGDGGMYSFTSVLADSGIATAIKGNLIGAIPISPGTHQDISLAASDSQQIGLPANGKLRATVIRANPQCTGNFGSRFPYPAGDCFRLSRLCQSPH